MSCEKRKTANVFSQVSMEKDLSYLQIYIYIEKETYSAIDHAMPPPSYVDVPRPNSSMITREFEEAL